MPLPGQKTDGLFSNSFLIFIIRFFPSLANLLVMILFSRHLQADAYGRYQNFWIQLYVISPIICFGIHVLLLTYARDTIKEMARRVPVAAYALYFVWATAAAMVFAVLQDRFLGGDLLFPFVFILFYSLTFILESFLVVCRNYVFLTITNIAFAMAWTAVHWYALQSAVSFPDLFGILLAIIVARFLGYAVLGFFNYRRSGGHAQLPGLDLTKIRSLWLHLGLYDVIQILFSYIDKFIISLVLSAQVSAIYYNGSQNIPFLPLLLSAAGSAVLLQLAAGPPASQASDSIRLMNLSGRLLSSVVFPVFLFLLLYRYELIVNLFSDKYIPALPVFFASVLVLPVRAYNFTTVLQKLHKGSIINTGAVADLLLALLLMYPLYRWLGLPGVALSFVITTYLQAAYYLYHTARLLHTSPFRLIPYANWLVKLIVFGFLFIAIHYFSKRYFNDWITLILGGWMLLMLVSVSLYIEWKRQDQNQYHPTGKG